MARVDLSGARAKKDDYLQRFSQELGGEGADVLRGPENLGPVRSGRLRASWIWQGVFGRIIRWYNPQDYASYMEQGTRYYTPPVPRPARTTLEIYMPRMIERAKERVGRP